jgi:hypothetical protein
MAPLSQIDQAKGAELARADSGHSSVVANNGAADFQRVAQHYGSAVTISGNSAASGQALFSATGLDHPCRAHAVRPPYPRSGAQLGSPSRTSIRGELSVPTCLTSRPHRS